MKAKILNFYAVKRLVGKISQADTDGDKALSSRLIVQLRRLMKPLLDSCL